MSNHHITFDDEGYVAVEDARPVRNEGTLVIFEGIVFEDDKDPQAVWFGVEHRMAVDAAAAAEEGYSLLVADYQIIAHTETVETS